MKKVLKRIFSVYLAAISVMLLIFSASAAYFSPKENILILPPHTTASEIGNVFSGNRRLEENEIIKTGCTLMIDGNCRNIAVLGDVNCDGNINSTDFIILRRHYLELFNLSGSPLVAADTNIDGSINSTDYVKVRNHFLDRINLTSAKPFSSGLNNYNAIIPQDPLSPASEEICLTDLNSGRYRNYYFTADFSNTSYGYFDISLIDNEGYDQVVFTITKGENENKFIVKKNLKNPFRFNFCYGDGEYAVKAIVKKEDKVFTALNFKLNVNLISEFVPFLISSYPTVYNDSTKYVKKAEELCSSLNSDFEKIAVCYEYIVETQEYKYTESTDEYKYLPDLDSIYDRQYGVCWDFCAALTAMLRSQDIPCKIDIGYAYNITNFGHAWLQIYIAENGSYNNEYLDLKHGWNFIDITVGVTKSPQDAKEYVDSMKDTYSPFKYF